MAIEPVPETREEMLRAGSTLEDFIDLEFEALCIREGDEDVTLEEVRRATASIPGSMAEAIIEEERADRL